MPLLSVPSLQQASRALAPGSCATDKLLEAAAGLTEVCRSTDSRDQDEQELDLLQADCPAECVATAQLQLQYKHLHNQIDNLSTTRLLGR